MNIAVMGTGHVGLVTAVAFATLRHDVVGTDTDVEKIAALQQGTSPFFEPGLEDALGRELRSGRLVFMIDPAEALRTADIVFICVGTPARADGEANLLAMERCAAAIARHAPDGTVVVEKSTVPAGTADRVLRTLHREGRGGQLHVASNPEFLREGSALSDALRPDRVVLGVESEQALQVLHRAYEPLTREGIRLIVTDIRTAELAKHASNAFLALKISFANALARLCERAEADVTAVADVMGADPRIGRAFLDAGLGYGGYCFPKDVAALERLASRLGYRFTLLKEVARLNAEAVEAAAEKVQDALWNLEGKRVAMLGLSFKPGTDDLRFAPALVLAERLLRAGAQVVAYDPQAGANAKEELPDLSIASDAYEAASAAHCLILATEWDEFRTLDLALLRQLMAYPVIVDGRNLFDPEEVVRAGFSYYPMGRPVVAHAADPPPGRFRPSPASDLAVLGQSAPDR